MDDGWLYFVEVTQCANNLHDDGASLLLRHQLVLFQVEVQVVAFAELQDGAETEENRNRGKFHSFLWNLQKKAQKSTKK